MWEVLRRHAPRRTVYIHLFISIPPDNFRAAGPLPPAEVRCTTRGTLQLFERVAVRSFRAKALFLPRGAAASSIGPGFGGATSPFLPLSKATRDRKYPHVGPALLVRSGCERTRSARHFPPTQDYSSFVSALAAFIFSVFGSCWKTATRTFSRFQDFSRVSVRSFESIGSRVRTT